MQEILVLARATNTRAAIREALNETRRITNPNPQCEGMSIRPKGHYLKKPKSSTSQEQYEHSA